MALIIEDGTQVANANSYVTEAELTAYATARGITITDDTEELLIKAMDYIESLEFIGLKVSSTQPLSWPRAFVIIDTYYVNIDMIPQELKNGQIEVALAIDRDQDPLDDVARTTQTETVGPLSVTYAANSASTTTVRKIPSALRKLLSSGGIGGANVNITRG